MFSIAVAIKRVSGEFTFFNGIIFPLPLELRDTPRLKRYAEIGKQGWVAGEFGYQTYSRANAAGDLYIFPGLRISGGTKIIKTFHGYKQEFSRDQIELLAAGIIKFAQTNVEIAQADLNLLVHDLRALSSGIYNSALEAEGFLNSENIEEALKRITNIKAAQAMLKMRTDALDFVGNPASIIGNADIAVYKKVDKVVRTFMSRSSSQGKFFVLRGPSVGRVRGPDILELVPYTLLDNALKYSPPGSEVEIDVRDGPTIRIAVSSLGPRIDLDERESIFAKGSRGRHAVAAGQPGSGVGLHIVDKIVREHFRGTITVEQDEVAAQQLDDRVVYRTTFVVQLPSI